MSLEFKKTTPSAVDEAEPKAERADAPVLLIGLFALLLFWGMVYLNNNGGGFNPQVYQPYSSFEEVDALNKAAHPQDPLLTLGKRVFGQSCITCHMQNGLGVSAEGKPPLAGSDWVQAVGPNRIIRIVLNGLTGPIQVNGTQFGTGQMVAFKDGYNDEQIAAALTYVRQEWGNKGGPIKPEAVTAIRKATADRPGPWTAAELLQVPEK